MSKFDDHWDRRIVANQRLFNERPGLANFTFDEAHLAYEFAISLSAERIAKLEKALEFYANEDKESTEDGILESVYDRPATAAMEDK